MSGLALTTMSSTGVGKGSCMSSISVESDFTLEVNWHLIKGK